MKKKKIRIRCWIDIDNKKFFGPGPAELLHLIEEHGSIAKAAKTMGMSYKKAWDLVNDLNSRGRQPYIQAHKGGKEGGGAELTPAGKKVLNAYAQLASGLQAVVGKHRSLLRWI